MLSPEQLEMRRTRLGGSDAPALFKLDPHRSPKALWKEKRGLTPPFQGNRHTERGEFLEDGVARWAAKRLGFEPDQLKNPGSLLHPTLEHVLATPDRLIETEAGLFVMQVKCPGLRSARLWTEPPAKVVCQLQWEMGLLEARGHSVARGLVVAFVEDDVRPWPIEFEPELAQDMHEFANEWFKRHVVEGVEP